MSGLSPLEQETVDWAIHYKSHEPILYKGEKPSQFDAWYAMIHQHMMKHTWPRITGAKEHLVQYWPTYFLWGARSAQKRAAYDDRHYLYKMGTFGTGYTCLTLTNLYVVSLEQATKKFPLFVQGTVGFISAVFGRMGGEVEDRHPLREDRSYAIPLESILDGQVTQNEDHRDMIALRTMNDQFQIHNHFNGGLERIETAIRMARTGRLAGAAGFVSVPQSQQISASENGDPVVKLKQLKQMLDAGLISPQEYERKKAEILAKM